MNNNHLSELNHRDAVTLLYRNVTLGLFMTLITSATLVFGLNTNNQLPEKVMWWLGMVLLSAIRWRLKVLYTKQDEPDATLYLRLFSIFAILTAGWWCFYGLFFYQGSNMLEQTGIMVAVAGFASGATTVLAANKFTSVAYVTILVLPYSILLTLGDSMHQTIGYLGIFFFIVIAVTAYNTSKYTLYSIEIKNKHAMLLSDLEKQVEERTQAFITLSNVDSLTGLLNRDGFLSKLNTLMVENPRTPLAVLFIDLDGFKGINDTLGHEVGDSIISLVAARIRSQNNDSLLLCRWGGDEFLVVVGHQDEAQTTRFSNQLIEDISAPYYHNNFRVTIGATIGIAIYPEHSTRKEVLIQHADMAMYQQKRLSKGSTGYFNEFLRQQLYLEFAIQDSLLSAIEKDELSLAYQPIIDSVTGKVVAFEALIRWENSDLGVIPPDQFIPIAEQYGQIKNIGLWVLEAACQQAKVFQSVAANIAICVNVSVSQFQDEDFCDKAAHIFKQHQFDPTGLHIEITESVFASDKHILVRQIQKLQSMGIKISIDDFGTGYSSLSSMQNIGVDIVKIDKSFVDNIHSSGLSIITAVMHIANELGYQVVAEGVENQDQADILLGLGVPYLQGYYFSKPVTKDQALSYLAHQYTP